MSSLRKDAGNQVTRDIKKADVLHNFLASVFTGKCASHTGLSCRMQKQRLEELRTTHYRRSDIRSSKETGSMGPDEIQLWVLWEPSKEVAKPLCIISEVW